MAAYRLTATEVLAALRAQNVQVSAGVLNQPPVSGDGAYQINVQTLGRLSTPEQFADIVVKTDDRGRVTRIRDIGRVEVGAADYGSTAYMDRSDGLPLLIFAQPGANSLAVEHEVLSTMAELKKDFPPGVDSIVIYDPTIFVAKSVREVVIDDLRRDPARRRRRHPVPADLARLAHPGGRDSDLADRHLHRAVCARDIAEQPVAVRAGAGGRHRRRRRDRRGRECRAQHRARACSPNEAAHRTMDEVGGALVSIALTLCAVFVPSAFLSGITGQFFRQFAVTIAASTVISCFVSLTLSPALCALLLKPHTATARELAACRRGCSRPGFGRFNRGFEWLSDGYGQLTRRLVRGVVVVVVTYVGLIAVGRVRVRPHADRVHSRAGPGLPDHRRAVAAGRHVWRAPSRS